MAEPIINLGNAEIDENADGDVVIRPDGTSDVIVEGAFSADELSDGVAGSGESITRIAGDAGDVVSPVFFRVPGTFTVSSTSFSSIGANADYPVFDDRVLDIQNATARRGAVAGWVNSLSDGETLTIRVEDAPESEIELTTTGRFMGPVADISGLSTTGIKRLEAEVSGGSAELRSLCTIIAREIQ